MKQVMVDLETKGNKPGCMILSIGAVFFDPELGMLGDQYYRVVGPIGQKKRGLHEDADTMAWWGKQSEEARQVLVEHEASAVTLEDGLRGFTRFLDTADGGLKSVKVWGNGSDFDNAILTVAYMAHQQNTPWEFWNNRCFRTLKNLAPSIKMEKGLLAHNALNDAIMQAEHAIKVLQRLKLDAAMVGGAL